MLNIIVSGEMQIKTTMRYYFTFSSMAIVKEKKDNNICGQGCGETRNFIHYW
jgi:hypothetical protein